ncbi:hypothetical protein T07_5170 [Trichinella nelsoni]|uniref:Uncharacterized protein n=1 Tax=Trichinella nelsoni TaxID=6336 RepID=A0A0V0SDJ3_9BILA|nr:hypothetical protein T07_5170 [Trichinella nelsoni]
MQSCNEDCAVLRIQDRCRGNTPSKRKDCETNKNYPKSANTWETPKTMLTRSNLMVNYDDGILLKEVWPYGSGKNFLDVKIA